MVIRTCGGRRVPRSAALVLALLCASLAGVPATASGNTIATFCAGNYGGGAYCNQGHYHYIRWIEAQASADAFCVMRATEGWAGAPSASGKEYCAGSASGGYVFQEFYGYGGFAQTHNRHSYTVSATPRFEYS